MKYAGETFARPEVLERVNARNFFIGEPDRLVIEQGISDARKYSSYIPCNSSQIPRALTEHAHVNTLLVTVSPMDASGHFGLGTNNDYASTVIRKCDRVIVEVNKNMPPVFGDSPVHISEVHAMVENHVSLPEILSKPPDEDSLQIVSSSPRRFLMVQLCSWASEICRMRRPTTWRAATIWGFTRSCSAPLSSD